MRDGEQVLLSRPHRRLLAYLALHPGPHERGALAARFWPDAPTARANLRTAVWALRRSLGGGACRRTRDDGRAGAGGPATSTSSARLWSGASRALDMLGAEPCVEFDDDWADAARAEHRRRLRHAAGLPGRPRRRTRPRLCGGRPGGAP